MTIQEDIEKLKDAAEAMRRSRDKTRNAGDPDMTEVCGNLRKALGGDDPRFNVAMGILLAAEHALDEYYSHTTTAIDYVEKLRNELRKGF